MTLMGAFKKTPASPSSTACCSPASTCLGIRLRNAFVSGENGIGIVSMGKQSRSSEGRIPGRIEWSLAGTKGIPAHVLCTSTNENWYLL